jgi:hypothetical protein
VPHDHPRGIARQALGRLSWNAEAVLEDRLPRLVGVHQHRSVDMNHHLVALARGTRLDAVVEGSLGDQLQRVGLLLLHRRRVRVRNLIPPPLVEGLAGRG